MKLMYNCLDFSPSLITYVLQSNIIRILLKTLFTGLKTFTDDEFRLHCEYIHVLCWISNYACTHSSVITNSKSHFIHESLNINEYDIIQFDTDGHWKTCQTIIQQFIILNNMNMVIDCILKNIGLYDKKDQIKAISILAQIFSCCMFNNVSCPPFLQLHHHEQKEMTDDDESQDSDIIDIIDHNHSLMKTHVLNEFAKEMMNYYEYIANCLQHNFQNIELLFNLLCFISNFTQILLLQLSLYLYIRNAFLLFSFLATLLKK